MKKLDPGTIPDPTPSATMVVDMKEIKLEQIELPPDSAPAPRARLTPPPLPPGSSPPVPSHGAPPFGSPSMAPAARVPSGNARLAVYGAVLLVVLGLGIAGGAVVARSRAPAAAKSSSSAGRAGSAGPSVITIPTVEMGTGSSADPPP